MATVNLQNKISIATKEEAHSSAKRDNTPQMAKSHTLVTVNTINQQ